MLMKFLPNPTRRPRIPEFDFSGTVHTLGLNVTTQRAELEVGTRVFGCYGPTPWEVLREHPGTLAEWVVLPEVAVVKCPEGLSLERAAGLGAAGCTAVNFLQASRVGQGGRVVVNGASGGVGSLVVPIARDIVGKEGTVVAVCGTQGVEMVRGLEADDIVDYRRENDVGRKLVELVGVEGVDVVIDCVGVQALYDASPGYLKKEGQFLVAGAMPPNGPTWALWETAKWVKNALGNFFLPAWLGGTPRVYNLLTTPTSREFLERVRDCAEREVVKGSVDSVWKMEDALMGYERLASCRAKGKIIIKVPDDL